MLLSRAPITLSDTGVTTLHPACLQERIAVDLAIEDHLGRDGRVHEIGIKDVHDGRVKARCHLLQHDRERVPVRFHNVANPASLFQHTV